MNRIELRGVTKRFGNLTANADIDFVIEPGKIYGLIGENGAGKTTLMRILYGMYQPDAGEILVGDSPVRFKSPRDAIDRGIGMVHQHFTLVPTLSVTQNIILGKPIRKKNGLLDIAKAEHMVKELGEQYHLEVPPKALIKDLPVSLQQRVEILKALYLGAELLIMDEPTAVLTPQEIVKLFETLVTLRNDGKTIILITHKLNEIMTITDEIMVLRLGKVTGYANTRDVDEHKIAVMMVGREINPPLPKAQMPAGKVVLDVKNLAYHDKWGVKALDNVSFSLREGEIVGIAGVQGNGQTELIDVLTGMVDNYTGSIDLGGHEIAPNTSVSERRARGLGCIPEDRQSTGAATGASILDNFIMYGYRGAGMSKGRFIDYKKCETLSWEYIRKFKVKIGSLRDEAYSLSGGNLQKLIIAREMYLEPQVLIAAQPSRGVDIGATEYIHETLIERRNKGKSVLLISNELSEIMKLSDRILVIYNGRIVGEATPEDNTEEDIGLLMAGVVKGAAQ